MEGKIVLSLFDLTTNIVRPWAEAGYLCYCIDLQHAPGEQRDGNIVRVGADALTWWPPYGAEIVLVIGQSPCTDVAVSGARWFKRKGLAALVRALALFNRAREIAEWCDAPYLLENPVSVISSHWRKPDYVFDPCDYGDPYTKKTCLWTGNGFVMPPKSRIDPIEGSKMHRLPPTLDRANLRSATPMGFARAVFASNHERIASNVMRII
jgi:hypothetical protein